MVSAVLLVDIYDNESFDNSFQAVEDILEVVNNLEQEQEEPKPKKKIKKDKNTQNTDEQEKVNNYEVLTDSLISLSSTSSGSLRVWLTEIFSLFVKNMPSECFGLVVNAVIKNDRDYLTQMILTENREDIISDMDEYSEGEVVSFIKLKAINFFQKFNKKKK